MQKENGKIRSEYLLAVLMCIAVAFFLTILVVSNSCDVQSPEESNAASSAASVSEPAADSSVEESSEGSAPAVIERVPLVSPARVTEGLLVPVYSDDPSEGGSAFGGKLENLYSFNGRTYASGSEHPFGYAHTRLELREDAIRALHAMAVAFHTAKGKTNLMVQSAYIDEVTSGSNRAIEENLATGCAVTFSVYPSDPDGDFLGKGKFLWLADNCTNYGYILRYPAEKEAATHVSGDNQLFRYVGYEHASYMGKLHLTLEEYLETVRVYTAETPLEVAYTDERGNERHCEVYFVSVSGGETNELPIRGGEGADFVYTGNGSDGIIVTCFLD